MLADGLALLTANDRHQQLLDRLVRGLARLVAENERLIRERIREESPWWVPELRGRPGPRSSRGRHRAHAARGGADPDHPLRRQLDELLGLDRAAAQSPEAIARAEEIKQQLLDHPTSERLTASLWREVKGVLDRQVDAAEQGDARRGGARTRALAGARSKTSRC